MNVLLCFLNIERLASSALLLVAVVCSTRGAQTNAAPALTPFELRDQYDTPHRISFPAANVTVMTVADRKGSEQIDGWIGPLKERYSGRIVIEGIADMSSVPCLFRSMVREQFKKDRAYPVMLDWEGPVARSFNCRKNEANVFVIDREGRMIGRFTGETNEIALRALFSDVDLALLKPSR